MQDIATIADAAVHAARSAISKTHPIMQKTTASAHMMEASAILFVSVRFMSDRSSVDTLFAQQHLMQSKREFIQQRQVHG